MIWATAQIRVSLYLPALNYVTPEADRVDLKLAFLCFYKQAVLKQSLNNLTDTDGVFIGGTREEEYTVQVHDKAKTKWLRKSLRRSFTRAWNIAGALMRPKGMTKYSR